MEYCGIDLASKASAICVMDDQQQIKLELMCATDEEGFRQALNGWQNLRCVIEASPLSEWVAGILESLEHTVIVIDPRKAKAVITSKKKTDKLDARNLARMALTGWYTEVHRKSAEARLLRSHLIARKGLVTMQRQQNNRIRGLLRAHGMVLGQVKNSAFVSRVRTLVEQRCADLWSAIEPLLEHWVALRRSLAQMTKRIKQRAQRDPVCRLLMTVPGVGPLVSSAYVATIDDPARFARSDQVGAYVGLVSRVHQSGETEYRGRITKEGDGLLRWLLVEAAHVLLTRSGSNSALKAWGKRIERRKGAAKAKVAVARKLAVILHRMWLTNTPFGAQATV